MKLLVSIKRRIIGLLGCALLLVSLSSSPTLASGNKYCVFTYGIKELPESLICSREALGKQDLKGLNNKILKTLRIYPRFITKLGYKWSQPDGINIIFLNKKEINSSELFARDTHNRTVLARYFPKYNLMYLTLDALKPASLDIPHEMAHHINDHIGISNEIKDEALAYEFEEYYTEIN